MIKFQGEISGACLNYILRRNAKQDLTVMLIGLPLFGIPITIALCAIHWKLIFLCLPFFALTIALCFLRSPKKDLGLYAPTTVIIDPQTQDLICESDKFHEESAFSLVDEVWDWGEWYEIRANGSFGHFFCQKDLLVQGTLEEFEALFADKIIKKQ